MTNTPLVPFTSPFETLSHLGISGIGASAFDFLIGFVIVVWLFYTLIAIYHWIKYSHASSITYGAIIVHFAVSGALMAYIFI